MSKTKQTSDLDEADAEKPTALTEETSLTAELKQGWVALVAVFGVNLLVVGYTRTFPVLYMAIREIFGSSATATSWVSGLQTLLRMCLGNSIQYVSRYQHSVYE